MRPRNARPLLTRALAFLALAAAGCDSPETEPSADGALPADRVEALAEEARERLEVNEGGRLVLRAIEAHGGLEAWYRAPTSSYTWEYANVGADLRFKSFLLADPGLNYERIPDEELDGMAHEMVRVFFEPGVGESPGDTYTLYVHPETGLVRAIRYTVSYGRSVPPGAELPETLFYYDDPVTVDGLTVATAYRGYGFSDGEVGAFRNEAFADSISFRRPFDPRRLVAPEGARFVPDPLE